MCPHVAHADGSSRLPPPLFARHHRWAGPSAWTGTNAPAERFFPLEQLLTTKKPDIRIRLGAKDLPSEDGDFRTDVPGVGAYVVRGGSEIVVLPEEGVDRQQLNLYLTASVWGALCLQRGIQILHGSAIQAGGRVFAFSGHSGAGKSTMAAWLVRRRCEPFIDDTGRLEIVGERVVLYPSSRRLKLWGDTVRALGQVPDGLTQVAASFEKFYVPLPGQQPADPAPLDAIYLLSWGDLDLRCLTGAEALERFLGACTYRPEYLDPMGRKQALIRNSIRIVGKVPIYELSRPQDIGALDDSIALLERHWNDDFA